MSEPVALICELEETRREMERAYADHSRLNYDWLARCISVVSRAETALKKVAATSAEKKITNAWRFASDWYNEEQIYQSIQNDRHPLFGATSIPADVTSREFASWLTEQYRLAMAKGIEVSHESIK